MSELEQQFQPLLNECDKLRILILDPQPGLATWHDFVRERLTGMRDELAKLLPEVKENWEIIKRPDQTVFTWGYETEAKAQDVCDTLNRIGIVGTSFYVRKGNNQ